MSGKRRRVLPKYQDNAIDALNTVYGYFSERNHLTVLMKLLCCFKFMNTPRRGAILWEKWWAENQNEYPMIQRMAAHLASSNPWKHYISFERLLNSLKFQFKYEETRRHPRPAVVRSGLSFCDGCILNLHYKKTDETESPNPLKIHIKVQSLSACIKLKYRDNANVTFSLMDLPIGGWCLLKITKTPLFDITAQVSIPLKSWFSKQDTFMVDRPSDIFN